MAFWRHIEHTETMQRNSPQTSSSPWGSTVANWPLTQHGSHLGVSVCREGIACVLRDHACHDTCVCVTVYRCSPSETRRCVKQAVRWTCASVYAWTWAQLSGLPGGPLTPIPLQGSIKCRTSTSPLYVNTHTHTLHLQAFSHPHLGLMGCHWGNVHPPPKTICLDSRDCSPIAIPRFPSLCLIYVPQVAGCVWR